MVRFSLRWPGRRKAWTAVCGAVAFVVTSGLVLSHPGPQPAPPLLAQRQVVSASTTTTANGATSSPATTTARPVSITTTPPAANRGITVYATPLGDGTLSMTETVRFDHRQRQLILSPPKVANAPEAFQGLVPTVSQIELTVDNHDVQIETRTLTSPLVVVLAAPGAFRVDVRYLLDHVVAPGPAGTTATSALVAPLIQVASLALDVSYVIGAQINSYGCPQLPTATARADCQALGRGSTAAVGMISGLPSSAALLVIGFPPGTTTPSPSDPTSPPPSGSSTPPPPSPPPSPPPTTPADTTPPPPTPSDPVPTTDPPSTPPPSEAPTDPPPTVPPTTDPAPPPTPTPTETATTPPPTDGSGGTDATSTPTDPPAAPAAAGDATPVPVVTSTPAP